LELAEVLQFYKLGVIVLWAVCCAPVESVCAVGATAHTVLIIYLVNVPVSHID